MEANLEMAATLLKLIWRGIPLDYKSRYRMTIWEQFENEVKAATYTSSLAGFISSICTRLRTTPGTNEAERAVAESILKSGNDRALLKMLREDTTMLVLMVRVDNEEKRAEWKARKEKEKEDEEE